MNNHSYTVLNDSTLQGEEASEVTWLNSIVNDHLFKNQQDSKVEGFAMIGNHLFSLLSSNFFITKFHCKLYKGPQSLYTIIY